MLNSKELIELLNNKNYNYDFHEHKPLFTVDDSKNLRGQIKGLHSKNLFLKNKKGKFFLISCEEFTNINLKKISKSLGMGNVSFANENYLVNLLGVRPGSVTPFALLNDAENLVDFYLEDKLSSSNYINFHPLKNTATITIKSKDFVEFMIENNKKIHIFSSTEEVISKIYE